MRAALVRLFVAAIVALLVGSACGEHVDGTPADAPALTPADLVADALAALADEGTAHFVVDATFRNPVYEETLPLVLHAEGDASGKGLTAEGYVDYGLGPAEGTLLLGEREILVYAKAFEQWYRTRGWGFGFAKHARALSHDEPIWLLRALSTEDGLRAYFDDVVRARVAQGPETDSVETWQVEGELNADGIARLVQGSTEDLDALEVVARASRVVVVVGQQDRLPRRIELEIDLSIEAAKRIDNWDAFELPGGGVLDTRIVIALSRFGEPVSYEPPANFKPLDELFERLFPGFE